MRRNATSPANSVSRSQSPPQLAAEDGVSRGGRRSARFLIVLAALLGALLLQRAAPDYLRERGFPLDDAWIHAVYGRELARSGTLAYNPGVAATGSTAPLWSAVVALPHLVSDDPRVIVHGVKGIGFSLHVLCALLLYAAFAVRPDRASVRLAGALLVAVHPDLIGASLSGMEVALAALAAAALTWATARASWPAVGAVAALAVPARPELAIIAVSLPLVAGAIDRRFTRLAFAGLLGSAAAGATLAARNVATSGWPLPATFYAKVGHDTDPLAALHLGFAGLLPSVTIATAVVVIGALAIGALAIRRRLRAEAELAVPVAAFVSGVIYCGLSFLLIPPHDPGAFYHQRYILPALPLMLASTPILVDAALAGLIPAALPLLRAAVLALLAAGMLAGAPQRYRRLANDARNIDDVQVALGRSLATAAPTDVVWAVDAGAVRYFGGAFVVDLMGLNTPEILAPGAQQFLDAHPPRYLDVVPLWSVLDRTSQPQFAATVFRPTTPYTVTGFAPMQTHSLATCPPAASGDLILARRAFRFACAPAARP